MSNNLPAVSSPNSRNLRSRLRALIPYSAVPAISYTDPADFFHAPGMEIEAYALKYETGYITTKRKDQRSYSAKYTHPFYPTNISAGKALLGDDCFLFEGQLLGLAKNPIFTGYKRMFNMDLNNQVSSGDITNCGVGVHEVVQIRLRINLFTLSNMLTLANQVIENSVGQKLSSGELHAVEFLPEHHGPLKLQDYTKTGEVCYYAVGVDGMEEIQQKGLNNIVYYDHPDNGWSNGKLRLDAFAWDDLHLLARKIYEHLSDLNDNIHVMEIRQMEVKPAELPAHLHAYMLRERAFVKLTETERRYVEEQRDKRTRRQNMHVAKLAAAEGVNEADDHIKSRYVWMSTNSESGLRGTVVEGNFANRSLRSLSTRELFELYDECHADADSLSLCRMYMDAINPPGWNQTAEEAFSSAAGEMTLGEAYKIIDVEPNADDDAVKSAYRKTAMVAHPDHGGTHESASRVNRAMERIRQERPDI